MFIACVVLFWAACAVPAWGLTLGNYTSKYPFSTHIGISLVMALFGPCGLAVALINGNGSFRMRPMSFAERKALYEASESGKYWTYEESLWCK